MSRKIVKLQRLLLESALVRPTSGLAISGNMTSEWLNELMKGLEQLHPKVTFRHPATYWYEELDCIGTVSDFEITAEQLSISRTDDLLDLVFLLTDYIKTIDDVLIYFGGIDFKSFLPHDVFFLLKGKGIYSNLIGARSETTAVTRKILTSDFRFLQPAGNQQILCKSEIVDAFNEYLTDKKVALPTKK